MYPISGNSASINEPNPSGQELHVFMANASHTQSSQAPPPNLARQDPLDGLSREQHLKICADLYKASTEDDWRLANDILIEHPELVRFSITKKCETTLHVAVSNRKTKLVKNLVKLMEMEDLALQDNNSYTAFCIAVTVGDTYLAKILFVKNRAQLNIPNGEGRIPLQLAASFGKYDMVKFLYNNTRSMPDDFWTSESRGCFLLAYVKGSLFDIALRVLTDQVELAVSEGSSLLKVLAQMPREFVIKCTSFGRSWDECQALKLLRVILKNINRLSWTEIYDIMRGPAYPSNDENMATRKYSSRVLYLAAEVGNIVFINEIIQLYLELLEEVNDINQSIFHVAVLHRHANIYALLNYIGSTKDRIVTLEDKNGNNMLHLVGMYKDSAKEKPYKHIRGPVTQMHRELSLFEEVESMLPLSLREKKNAIGYTPLEEFTRYHRGLVYECEKWMKDIGTQMMVVATLIATISFAATITFAGGYNQGTGFPMFGKTGAFHSFILYCSFAFALASFSILSILNLLTSPFEDRDFLRQLSFRLRVSASTLFSSILFMLTAFGMNLFMIFEGNPRRISDFLIKVAFTSMCMLFVRYFIAWKLKLRYNQISVPPMEYIVL